MNSYAEGKIGRERPRTMGYIIQQILKDTLGKKSHRQLKRLNFDRELQTTI